MNSQQIVAAYGVSWKIKDDKGRNKRDLGKSEAFLGWIMNHDLLVTHFVGKKLYSIVAHFWDTGSDLQSLGKEHFVKKN